MTAPALAALLLPACLNRLNVDRDDVAAMDADVGIVFGRFDVAAPEPRREDVYLRDPGGFIDTRDGAVVKVERAAGGSAYRFRLPPNGEFRWALPEGEYRVTHWKGLLLEGPPERLEAHLGLDATFTVTRGRASAVGAIRFDGSSLTVIPATPGELDAFRAALPEFAGDVVVGSARPLSVRPPVRILRYALPGGGDGDCAATGVPTRDGPRSRAERDGASTS